MFARFFSTFLAVVSVVFSHSNAIAQYGSPLGGFVLEASYSPESGVTAELSYATDSTLNESQGYVVRLSAFGLNSLLEDGQLFTASILLVDGDLKKVPDKDIKKIDAHKFKGHYVGESKVSKYNIYKDKDGKVVLMPVKKDSGNEKVETDMTWDEVLEEYPAKKKDFEVEGLRVDFEGVPAE